MLDSIFKFLGLARIVKPYDIKSSVARWAIYQYISCPYCKCEFDIIATNLKRKTNQGTVTISQKQVSKFDKDKFEYNDVISEIPTPPYFGVMMEDCDNLKENISCVKCTRNILVESASWGYGK